MKVKLKCIVKLQTKVAHCFLIATHFTDPERMKARVTFVYWGDIMLKNLDLEMATFTSTPQNRGPQN